MDSNEEFGSFPQQEEFPFPKLVKTFDFFFPKEKHSKNFFTMENLRKFGPKAPFLGLIILMGVFSWAVVDSMDYANSGITAFCMLAGVAAVIFATAKYLFWLVLAAFSKIARRSPVVCLAMTASGPLQALAISCIVHFIGFVCKLIASAFANA